MIGKEIKFFYHEIILLLNRMDIFSTLNSLIPTVTHKKSQHSWGILRHSNRLICELLQHDLLLRVFFGTYLSLKYHVSIVFAALVRLRGSDM